MFDDIAIILYSVVLMTPDMLSNYDSIIYLLRAVEDSTKFAMLGRNYTSTASGFQPRQYGGYEYRGRLAAV
jgi:hypothetical protein